MAGFVGPLVDHNQVIGDKPGVSCKNQPALFSGQERAHADSFTMYFIFTRAAKLLFGERAQVMFGDNYRKIMRAIWDNLFSHWLGLTTERVSPRKVVNRA